MRPLKIVLKQLGTEKIVNNKGDFQFEHVSLLMDEEKNGPFKNSFKTVRNWGTLFNKNTFILLFGTSIF